MNKRRLRKDRDVSSRFFAVDDSFVVNTNNDNCATQMIFFEDEKLIHEVFLCGKKLLHQTHKFWAVGFAKVDPIYEEVEHPHIASVVIHLKLAVSKPGEQTGADVPAPMKRE